MAGWRGPQGWGGVVQGSPGETQGNPVRPTKIPIETRILGERRWTMSNILLEGHGLSGASR